MTERTITGVEVNDRRVFKGGMELHAVYGHYNFAHNDETVSATLVVQVVALPDQARVQDLYVITEGFGGTGGYVVGDSSLSNRYMTLASLSVAAGGKMVNYMNVQAGRGYKVSLTPSSVPQFYPINVTINGAPSATRSGCIAMCVWYTIDNAAT